MTCEPLRLAIAGGGTGGHLFPGLAVAERALATGAAESVVFFGAERGIESRLVPAAGHELVAQPLSGIRGGGPLGALRGLVRLAGAILRARAELRRRRVDVLIGLGGYASSAGVIAARLAGVPVVLLEQNRDPGLSNRTLARVAAAVCTSFSETAEHLPRGKARLTGNPVRSELEDGGSAALSAASAERDTLLVFGGSAGALTINRAVATALSDLADAGLELPRVLHQTGKRGAAEAADAYAVLAASHPAVDVETCEFIDDMGAAYRRARLAVCRAGATSVAELIATATPAVLVPYPHATGDHQTANARALERAGAALLVADGPELAADLTKALARLLRNPGELDSMAGRAAELGRPGAADRVLETVMAAARAESGDAE